MVLALFVLTTAVTSKVVVPPQRTRKTCIRNNKVTGNLCPICQDHKLYADFRNVKLLEQFVCAHTGIIFHAPYTGVCMKQHRKLTQAIQEARECGLLSYYVPQVEPRDADFGNVHGAVTVTPPAPTLLSGEPWYPWYSWHQPPERTVSPLPALSGKSRKKWPLPESLPEVPSTPPAETSTEQMDSQSA
ncbi:28S ribosomal protein S18b, mitochondrial [Sigmodon hispidus]